jgi:hypothetical protein
MRTVPHKMSSQWVTYNCQSLSLCLSCLFLPKSVIEKLAKTKDVPLGEITPEKLLTLLLCAGIQAQANLFLQCFLRKKSIWAVTSIIMT